MKRALLFPVLLLCLLPTLATAQEVTGLAGWNIYLDQGHSQTGNRGVFGYSEAEKVLRVGLALQEMLLTTTDIDTVYVSRTNDVQSVSLSQRVDHANSVGAAHFHSIHSNAAGPTANFVFVLWAQFRDGSEAIPNGGKRMAELMGPLTARSMRIGTRFDGAVGECDFYGVSDCRTRSQAPKGSRNFVQGFTVMPSELSEAGFHTNPTQNQRNMNAEWKRLEARALYWSILDFFGLERPPVHTATGIITDLETGLPINGATVTLDGQTYTTDTFASLFNRYSNDPEELRNGFYFIEDLPGGTLPMTVTAENYAPMTVDVALSDTFFTFQDIALISTVLPTIAATSPEPGAPAFRITDPIIIEFSRQMDRASVEAAFSISPEVDGTVFWSEQDQRLLFQPAEPLMPRTTYTLTIDGSAVGRFGDAFDANGDGTGGDAFTLTFLTGFPDTQPPQITGSVPRVNARDVELRPVVSIAYDELIDPATLTGRVHVERLANAREVTGIVTLDRVGEQHVVSFFPDEELLPGETYRFFIEPGVTDLFLNEETKEKQFSFTTGTTRFIATRVEDFENDVEANWWVPQQSGSTTGIVTDSTTAIVDTEVFNRLGGGMASFRLDYGWDDGAGPWLIREFLNGGPPRAVVFDDTYILQAYVFGDGSGNQFRFAVDDGVGTSSAGHEVSPWYTVDWLGWKLVSWNLSEDGTGTWIGDGTLDGMLRFDSFQLTHVPDAPLFGQFYVDDLRLAMPEATNVASETTPETPEGFTLFPNYPNPFNPQTTLRFVLPEPAAVTLTIYNAAGAEVATLADRRLYAPGTHELVWNAASLPSGVYFGRMAVDGTTRSIRMVLVK